MTTLAYRFAFVGETVFPLRVPFFLKACETSRFSTQLHSRVSTGVVT